MRIARYGRTTMGMGRGAAATWPTKRRERKKARTADGEKNIAVRRKRVGGWRLVGGAKRQ